MLGPWVLALLLGSAAQAQERWAGVHVAEGERQIPIAGLVRTQTVTRVLADVVREPDGRVRVRETPCDMSFAPVAGASVWFDPSAFPKMPANEWVVEVDAPSPVSFGWDASDVDGDAWPGVTLYVRAPVCLGRVYVQSWNTGHAEASTTPDGMRGTIDLTIDQSILGVGGACLGVFIQDAVEHMRGTFEYVRVADDATCASLDVSAWPVVAAP